MVGSKSKKKNSDESGKNALYSYNTNDYDNVEDVNIESENKQLKEEVEELKGENKFLGESVMQLRNEINKMMIPPLMVAEVIELYEDNVLIQIPNGINFSLLKIVR